MKTFSNNIRHQDDHSKAKHDYLRNRRLIESTQDDPYRILRVTKIALIEMALCTKISEFGPVTIIQLFPLFKDDVRLLAQCTHNIEHRGWVKVLYIQNGCKYFVKHNWKETLEWAA